jgi:gliding motility-associated-like protein
VIVNFSGAFVSNIVDVYYAGFNSNQNNNHCGFPISTSSFTGVNQSIVTVDVVPQVNIISPPNPNNILSLPNGNNTGVVAVYSCDTSTYQGGANTIDQVVDVFQQRFGGALRGLIIQYCCWLETDFYRLSAVTGNCCNASNSGIATMSYPPGPFCIGSGQVIPLFTGDSSGTFISDPPSLPIDPATGLVDLSTASPGTYIVTYTVAANCIPNVYTDTIVINNGSASAPSFSYPNPLCIGAGPQAVQPLSGFIAGGVFNSTPAGLVINPSTGVIDLNASQSGIYSISYIAPSGICGPGQSFTFPGLSILSSQLPYSIVASDSCNLNALNVQLSGSAGVQSITWNMGDPAGGASNIVNGSTNVHQYSQPGNYVITAIVQTLCGPDTIRRNIQSVAPTDAVLSFSYPDDPCRTGNLAPITVAGFATGGVFSSTPALPINSSNGIIGDIGNLSGVFTITYTYPGFGCITPGTSSFDLNITAPVSGGSIIPSEANILKGDTIQIVASGLLDYSWQPGEGLSCTNCDSPLAYPEESTIYTVSGTNSQGCLISDTILIKVDIKCNEVFAPDIFSPNGAGPLSNEKFCVYSNCSAIFNLVIFDRWGQQIFSSNEIENCWDGSYQGKEVPSGVYAYDLYLEQLDGVIISKKGTIRIIR